MKDWKESIEALGFHRCCYEKKEHLHCMAFRKISDKTDYDCSELNDQSKNMYIPQDFNTELSPESLTDHDDAGNLPKAKRKKLDD